MDVSRVRDKERKGNGHGHGKEAKNGKRRCSKLDAELQGQYREVFSLNVTIGKQALTTRLHESMQQKFPVLQEPVLQSQQVIRREKQTGANITVFLVTSST